jgi:hypothetical protein
MNLMRTSCIRIPQQFESEEWCKNILRDLTRTGTSYEDPAVKITSVFYEKRDGHICIPRFYPIENYGHNVIDYITDGEDINIDFTSEWRSDLQRQAFDMMTTETRGVLKLKPGEGKTVISIGSICKLKKKAIIFVHKDSLATQWKERFLQHTNITEDQIGLLTTADRFDILKKNIVISTVQTMNSIIDRVPDFEKLLIGANFGIGVWDECHTSSAAEKFSRTALYTPCKKVFGLSATPERSDGHHAIIHMHLGQLFEPQGKSETMIPKIIILYFDHKVVSHHKKYVYWGIPGKDGRYKLKFPRFDSSRYLAMLTSKKNDIYIPFLRKIIKQVYDAGRVTLLISDRIKILDMTASVISNKSDIGFFIPRSGKERDSDLLKRFVFSTPGSSRDGTDRVDLDCLIMANRISNIEQAIGRVCRPKPNKKQPVVFDIVDTGCEELLKSSLRRKEFYTQQGWTVEEKHLK